MRVVLVLTVRQTEEDRQSEWHTKDVLIALSAPVL